MRPILVTTVLMMLIATACSGSSTDDIDAAKTGESEAANSPQTPTATATERATETPTPTATATAVPRPEGVVKVDEGFVARQNSYDGKYRHEWYVTLQNESSKAANNIPIQVRFYASDGLLLGSEETYGFLWSQQETVISGLAPSFDSQAVRMEVKVGKPSRMSDVKTASFPTVSDVQVVQERYSGSVTGKVTSPWDTDVENLSVTCILRDAEGGLLAVEHTWLQVLPSATTAVAECSLFDDEVLANAAEGQMFVSWSIITDVPE